MRLLVPAPSISVAIFAPFAGLIADRHGRRLMLLAGVMLFVIAGCAGLFLPDLPTIFACRLIVGSAVALIMTAQTALIGDYFTGEDRSALSGFQISARNFGGSSSSRWPDGSQRLHRVCPSPSMALPRTSCR